MDESHRYRASAGIRAFNGLRPIPGLELTATPHVETSRGAVAFKNVILDYPLARAMTDGFVKEPAVVTRKDFDPGGVSASEIKRMSGDAETVPAVEYLNTPEVQAAIVQAVEAQLTPAQLALQGLAEEPDIASVVAMTVDLVARQTIDIPRILVVPKGEVRSGFKPFTLELATLRCAPVSDELWSSTCARGNATS